MNSTIQPAGSSRNLEAILRRAGIALDPGAAQDILSGVAAAPMDIEEEAWLALIGAQDADAQTRAVLMDWRRDHAGGTAVPEDGKLPAEVAAARLSGLRAELKRQNLDGFIVTHADEHQGEYLPARAERLAYLTGFTGSAGLAIVLTSRAAIFTDGRYSLQVRDQVDAALYDYKHLIQDRPSAWLVANAAPGMRIGYDPWLHTGQDRDNWLQTCIDSGLELVPVTRNPVDAIWSDQPPPPLSPVRPHDEIFSGRSAADKRQAIAQDLKSRGLVAAILTAPDIIAWLLNIRGGDVPRTPLPLSFAILRDDASVDLFIDPRKVLPATRAHLGNQVALHAPEALGTELTALGRTGKPILTDPNNAAAWIIDRLKQAGAKLVFGDDPCLVPRACKNPVEIKGAQSAHRRDGAALARFLHWLSREAPKETVTEIGAVEKLYAFRRVGEHFRDLSFETISGAGPNGAIVHYRVTKRTDRTLRKGELFLLDSGAQYLDGTTDVTRTLAVGMPSADMRDRFTRVLKGHIALAAARFPQGTTGSQLDALARAPLWAAGLDFDHGTGHGVGSYLSVHEGPQRISTAPSRFALRPGMILSDEPGYYKTGDYGIRIENLILVRDDPQPGDERAMLAFDVLTLVPIDRNLIDAELLSSEERRWLNTYHARVRAEIGPLVEDEVRAWLDEATQDI